MTSAHSSVAQSATSSNQENQDTLTQRNIADYPSHIQAAVQQSELEIAGIKHPVVICYFDWLNQEAYDQAVELFAEDGILYAPFESGIQGRTAIADYLKTEAKGMQLQPREGVIQPVEDDADAAYQILVTGKVQTIVFNVNVQWTFLFNPDDQLASVRVKLLASPKELLNLRR